ncbi:peptide ABC transporter substrate-binding protein [Brachyspira sp. G79]|uniref:peptide ABC transporter substrate-binding protein n=1 Tax=Brachyspira sp. G79 TaxID=1358104 RepID=UPI000BBC8362|nr:peptide ABC transporter substrate-binding protein [Brachyspira sp. G79]PCG20294.1 peptide ABC transporter substrate-binding protein [Brachyspira sp. G79]
MLKKIITFNLLILSIISCSKVSKKEINTNNDIVINLAPEPLTIDPTLNTDNLTMIYILHAFEGLTKKDADNKIIGGAAESWDINREGNIYTFHIRTNAKWSDGKSVTAKDFVYTWRRAVDPKTANKYSYYFEVIKNAKEVISGKKSVEELGVRVVDDYTFEVELNSPTAYFLELTAYPPFYPVREDIINKYGDEWTLTPESYIGNGAFKMTERNFDKNIILERNNNYWNNENIKPNKLTFLLMEEPNTSLAGILNDSIHFAKPFPRNDIETLKKKGIVHIVPVAASYYYRFNLNNKKELKDNRVRRALSLAIDRDYIVKSITKCGERPAGSLVPYGINDVNGDFREKGGDNINIDDYKKNIEEARKLLAEAGYENGKNFPVLDLLIATREFDVNIADAVQNMIKDALNIDVRIVKYEWASYLQNMYNKDFDMAVYLWYADYNDPINFLNIFKSDAPNNYGSYSNNVFDDYINIASTNKNNNIRMHALHLAEDIFIKDNAIIPIYFYSEALLVYPKLKGIEYDSQGLYRFFNAYLE